jgi:hypothetical protein
MCLVALNAASLSSKQLAFVLMLGTYVALPYSVGLPAVALRLDVFMLIMQLVVLLILLSFLFYACDVLLMLSVLVLTL